MNCISMWSLCFGWGFFLYINFVLHVYFHFYRCIYNVLHMDKSFFCNDKYFSWFKTFDLVWFFYVLNFFSFGIPFKGDRSTFNCYLIWYYYLFMEFVYHSSFCIEILSSCYGTIIVEICLTKRPDALTCSAATLTLGPDIGPLGHFNETQRNIFPMSMSTGMMRNQWKLFWKNHRRPEWSISGAQNHP